MDWRVKGVIQKVLSRAPFGMRVNDVLQRTFGELRNFDASLGDKIEDWRLHMGHLDKLDVKLDDKRVFEIGTGWFPTFPICYALANTQSIVTFDLERHLNEDLTFKLLDALEAHLPTIASACGAALPDVRSRYDHLRKSPDLMTLLDRARIEYHAPADATQSGLPDDTVDIIFSNSVLEHVPEPVLVEMMRESKRILRPGGFVMHSVNCGDHYAYFDRNINFMNYLQYDEKTWEFWNNSLQYQNRLRPQAFIDMTLNAGLEMLICIHEPKPELLAALDKMTLDPAFRGLPPEELATRSIDIIAKKP